MKLQEFHVQSIARKIAKLVAALLCLCLIAVVGAFGFLNSSRGKKFIVRKVEHYSKDYISGTLTIGDLRGSLLKEITLNDISLKDKSGRPIASIGEVALNYKLHVSHRPFLVLNFIDVKEVSVARNVDANGVSNWDDLLKPSAEEPQAKKPDKTEPAVWAKLIRVTEASFVQTQAQTTEVAIRSLDLEFKIPETMDRLPEGFLKIPGQFRGRSLLIQAEVKGQKDAEIANSQAMHLEAQLGSSQISGELIGHFNLNDWPSSQVQMKLDRIHFNSADVSSPNVKTQSQVKVPTMVDGQIFGKIENKTFQNSGKIEIFENKRSNGRISWDLESSHLTTLSSFRVNAFQWQAQCPLLKLQRPTLLTINNSDPLPVGEIQLSGCAGSLKYHRFSDAKGEVHAAVDALKLGPIMKALGLPRNQSDRGQIDLDLTLPEGMKRPLGSLRSVAELPQSLLGGKLKILLNSKWSEQKAIVNVSAGIDSQKVVAEALISDPFSKGWELNKDHASATATIVANALDLKRLHELKFLSQPLNGHVNLKAQGSGSLSHARLLIESTGNSITMQKPTGDLTPPVSYKTAIAYDERQLEVSGGITTEQKPGKILFQARVNAPFEKLKTQGVKALKTSESHWSVLTKDFDLSSFIPSNLEPTVKLEKISLSAKVDGEGSIENPTAHGEAFLNVSGKPFVNLTASIEDQRVKALLKAHDASLDHLVPLASPYVILKNSRLNANFIISGLLTELQYGGSINFIANEIDVSNLQVKYTDPALMIQGVGNRINITKFHLGGGKGAIDGSGGLVLDKAHQVQVAQFKAKFQNFAAIANDKMSVISSGDLNLNVNQADSKFGGEILISQANITLPEKSDKKTLEPLGEFKDVVFKQELEKQPEEKSPLSSLTGAVHIKIPNRFWVKGPDVAIDLKADLYAGIDDDQELFLKGTVDAQRGFVEIFGKHFDLRKAQVEFLGDYTNPRIDVAAMYQYSPRNIVIALNGAKESLKPELFSEPAGYSEDECIGVLLTGSPNYQGGGGGANVGGLASGFVVGQLKKKLGSKLPFDTITADLPSDDEKADTAPRSSQNKKANLEVGKYISDRAFLKVGRAFATQQSGAVNMITLDYRLSEKWSVETKQTDGGRSDVGFQWTTNY